MIEGVEVLRRADARKPARYEKVVLLPSLGGAVRVVGLSLAERYRLLGDMKDDERRNEFVGRLLAQTVRDADNVALYTADEWDVWAATAPDAELRELLDTGRAAAGMLSEEERGNSPATPT